MKKSCLLVILFISIVNSSYNRDVIVPMENITEKENTKLEITNINIKRNKPEMFKLIYFHRLVFVDFLMPCLNEKDTKTIFYLFHFLNVNRGYSLPPWHYKSNDLKIINNPGTQFLFTFQDFKISNRTISLPPILYFPQNENILFPNPNIIVKLMQFGKGCIFSNDELCPVDTENFFNKKGNLRKLTTFKKENEFVVTDNDNEILAQGECKFDTEIAVLAWKANNLGYISCFFCGIIFYIQRFCLLYPRYLVFAHKLFAKFAKIVGRYTGSFSGGVILTLVALLWYPIVITLPFHLFSLPWVIKSQNCQTGLFISLLQANIYIAIFPWVFEMFVDFDESAQTQYLKIAKMFEIKPKRKNTFAIPMLAMKEKILSFSFGSLIALIILYGLLSVLFVLLSIVPMVICVTNFRYSN